MACNRRSGTPSTPSPPPSVPILFIYLTIRRPSEKLDYTISVEWHIVNPYFFGYSTVGAGIFWINPIYVQLDNLFFF